MNKNHAVRVVQRRLMLCVMLGLVGVIVLFVVLWQLWDSTTNATTPEALLSQSQAALKRGEYDLAEALATRIERDEDCWAQSRLVAGEAATRAGRIEDAIEYYQSVPQADAATSVPAKYSLGELYCHIGRLSYAMGAYSSVLEQKPTHIPAHQKMAFLLELTGQRWNAHVHYMFLLRSGTARLDDLIQMGDLERHREQVEYLRKCAEYAPDDLLVQLGKATNAVVEGKSAEARRLLRKVIAQTPDLVAAQAMLGELLVETDDETFAQWHAALPSASEDYPDTWFVRGLWAQRRGQLRVAARCFWETVRLAPTHRRGNLQLGQVLVALNETSGPEFAERSHQIFKLTKALDEVLQSKGQNEEAVKRVAEFMETMGRQWEALAWAGIASELYPSATWPQSVVARLELLLNEDVPRTVDSANLALKYDLSEYPNHMKLLARIKRETPRDTTSRLSSSIHFEEASAVGIDFVYYNGPDLSTKGRRMFELTGGGVAVLDFDGDEWPDLYFTQGAEWKHGAVKPTPAAGMTDRLYRNVGGRSFVDVTRETYLGNQGFGQGPAVGDFNGDGFPDLYVANIGRNRLYRNNGDGTFSDVTEEAGLTGDDWTASCVIVDLNADGLPDLFDVNYLTGLNVYTIICSGRTCTPALFDGVPDCLHLNRGDGTFEFVPNATPKSDAKGMGVVAVDLQVRGRPCLFITNDQVPNFLLRNYAEKNLLGVRLQNEGFLCGLAYDEDGLPMGSMGIAADDVDGDGRIDFFVTNFEDEPNTLSLQDSQGFFSDATKQAGLHIPSWSFIGWGTQFLDADRDGDVDLVVANGHVDDYRDEGGQFHMRPQFFQNTGSGRFVERLSIYASSFFKRKYLGRGLARLDWNRDGRMDFVVSNIGARASLVTNKSTGVGHFINVRLYATATARDAIGSVVEVVTDGHRWSKQLVAGDGYMASNERMLQFGLAEATSVRDLRVNWPSGDTTTIRNLPVDVTVDLVEGASRGTLWRGSKLNSLVVLPQPPKMSDE